VGSTGHGTTDGADDLDLLSIVIPFKEKVLGLDPFDHYIYRTAAVREGKQDARSMPGDVDLTFYSLRKFAGLAKKGNPSILMAFFAPIHWAAPLGLELREASGLFRSKEAGYRFMGYMKSQRARLAGERGQKGVNRPELVEKYGWDTKYGYHLLRLGFQGLEFIKHGKIHMPMLPWVADFLKAVRLGGYQQEQVLRWASEIEQELADAIEDSGLPKTAPQEPIDKLLVDLHMRTW
jgi:hypothetical protein